MCLIVLRAIDLNWIAKHLLYFFLTETSGSEMLAILFCWALVGVFPYVNYEAFKASCI